MTKTQQKELRTASLLLVKANAPERPSESGETMVNTAGKRGVGTMESQRARASIEHMPRPSMKFKVGVNSAKSGEHD